MNPLDQLHDIVVADPVSWWPLAIGWWLLALIVLVGGALVIIYFVRRQRALLWKREALHQIASLKSAYFNEACSDTSNRELNSQLVILLKRVMSSANSTGNVNFVSQTSSHWEQTLLTVIPELSKREVSILSQGHYYPQVPRLTIETFAAIETWIRRLK